MTREQFRKQCIAFLSIEMFILASLLIAFKRAANDLNIDLQLLLLLALTFAQLAIGTIFYRKGLLRGDRLKEIHPDLTNSNIAWSRAYILMPLPFLLLLAYQFTKTPDSSRKRAPIYLRRRRFVALVIAVPFFLLALSVAGFGSSGRGLEKVSYWLATGSTYMFAELSDEVKALATIKRRIMHEAPGTRAITDLKALAEQRSFTSTGRIMMAAIVVSERAHKKGREPKLGDEIALEMIEDLIAVLEIWDANESLLGTFNPVLLASPAGAIEVSLLCVVEWVVEHRTAEFTTEISSLLHQSAARAKGASEMARINLLQNRLNESRHFRMIVARNQSLFWPKAALSQ